MIEQRVSDIEGLLATQQLLEHTADDLRPTLQLLSGHFVEDAQWGLFAESTQDTLSIENQVEQGVLGNQMPPLEFYKDIVGSLRFGCGVAARTGKLPRFVHGLYGDLGPDWRSDDDYPGWSPETEDALRDITDEAGGPEEMIRSLKATAQERMLRAQISCTLIGAYMLRRVVDNPSLQLSLPADELIILRDIFPAASIVARSTLRQVLDRDLEPKHRRRQLLEVFSTIDTTIRPFREADMPQEPFKAWDEQCGFVRTVAEVMGKWPTVDRAVASRKDQLAAKDAAQKTEQDRQAAEAARQAYLALEKPFAAPSMKSLRKTPYWQFMQALTGHPPKGSACPQLKPLPDMADVQQLIGLIKGVNEMLQEQPDSERVIDGIRAAIADQERHAAKFIKHRPGGSSISEVPSIKERLSWLNDRQEVIFEVRRTAAPSLHLDDRLESIITQSIDEEQ